MVSDTTVWAGLVGTALVLIAVGVAAYELTEGNVGQRDRSSRRTDLVERVKRVLRDPIAVMVVVFGLFGAFVLAVFVLGL